MSILATKLPGYLKRLAIHYADKNEDLLRDLIITGRWLLRECTDHDNWNGGSDGHTVVLFAPYETIGRVAPNQQRDVSQSICSDLRDLNSVDNEYFAAVVIEAEDEADEEFQRATPFAARPAIDPDSLSIWKPGLARIFISHRDAHKIPVKALAEALEKYGLSCFVAHETIPANKEWQKTIVGGLETMEVMLAVVTDNFHESVWTMQEIGFALGKGIPVIALKTGRTDPPGFISHLQAQRGSLDDPASAVKKLFPLLGDALRSRERLQEVIIRSFCTAPSYMDAIERFDRMKGAVERLSDSQQKQICEGYRKNDQLHGCAYLVGGNRRLVKFMDAATGLSWDVGKTKLHLKAELGDDIPF